MALEYFLYRTDIDNTLVNRSDNSFAPLAANTGEIQLDFFIPQLQPLYFYRVSGGTIVINTNENIDTYLNDTQIVERLKNKTKYKSHVRTLK